MRASQDGLTLVETLVALLLLGFVLLTATAAAFWSQRSGERLERRAVALDVASSLAEGVRARPHGSVRSERVDLEDDAASASLLPEGAAEIDVREDEDLGVKHVSITVSWGGADPGSLSLRTAVSASELWR